MGHITQEDIQDLAEFEKGDLDLKIVSDSEVIFQSDEEGIVSVVSFAKGSGRNSRDLIIFDRVVGQAVALLFAYLSRESSQKGAMVKKVLGVTGSQIAEEVLKRYQIPSHFLKTVPYIANRDQSGPCPFELLSEGKTPEEFWKIVSEKC